MSVIESLLGPAPGGHAGKPVHAIRTLLVHDDVLIHLQEDESREEVALYSRPGWMQPVDWLSEHTEAWSHVLPLPGHEPASSALTVDPATRQVFLSETWPRAALDPVVLGERLNAHAELHRLWQRMLQAPGDLPADGSVA